MSASLGKCARWIPANGDNKHNTALEAEFKGKYCSIIIIIMQGNWDHGHQLSVRK